MQLYVSHLDVTVQPTMGRKRSTVHDIYVVYAHRAIYIAAPFEFDGASIPFFLWWWVRPWSPWVVLAACVHDYVYSYRYYTRRECDRLFLELLIYQARQHRWRWLRYCRTNQARIMYQAVRQFGALAAGADW